LNVLRGKLNKKNMAKFAGVETLSAVDKSLARLADMGYLRYSKIKGGMYKFTLFSDPIEKELTLDNEAG